MTILHWRVRWQHEFLYVIDYVSAAFFVVVIFPVDVRIGAAVVCFQFCLARTDFLRQRRFFFMVNKLYPCLWQGWLLQSAVHPPGSECMVIGNYLSYGLVLRRTVLVRWWVTAMRWMLLRFPRSDVFGTTASHRCGTEIMCIYNCTW